MRQSIHRLIVTILLGVFSVFLIPREFVHELYGHTDTDDHRLHSEKQSIGTHHIHCDFLTFEASLFTITTENHSPSLLEIIFSFSTTETENSGNLFSDLPSLRGPPQL